MSSFIGTSTATGLSQLVNVLSIVKTGLMINLDASDVTSYPGSGTTWTDISGNGKNATLTNGPTYSSNDGGYISFDATDDYVITNSSLYSSTTYPNESLFIWWYPTAAGNIISELGQATPNSGWHDSNIEITAGGIISFSTWHGSLTNKVVSTAKSLNTWYHLGFTYSGTTLTAYINGVSIGTTTFTRSTNSVLYYAIGAIDTTNMGTGAYAAGNCGAFYNYNKALTSDEVLQNYNATKSRYGL
jgi:hypothetical protein